MSNSGKNFQRTFNQYVRRNQGWVFIILTLVILFLSVFIFRSFSKTTPTPLENYQDQMTKMQEQINSQAEKIQLLEEQIKKLQKKLHHIFNLLNNENT